MIDIVRNVLGRSESALVPGASAQLAGGREEGGCASGAMVILEKVWRSRIKKKEVSW